MQRSFSVVLALMCMGCVPDIFGEEHAQPREQPDQEDPGTPPTQKNDPEEIEPVDDPDREAVPEDIAPAVEAEGGLAGSIATTPKFHRKYSRSDVPQIAKAKAVFKSARPVEADTLKDAVLLCHVETKVNLDTFRRNDLLVQMRVGGGPEVSIWGPQDSLDAYVSVPLVEIHKGDIIGVSAFDRDETANEMIQTSTVEFKGRFPLVFPENSRMATTCRILARDEADERARKRLKRWDKSLKKVGKAMNPNPTLLNAGYEKSGLPGSYRGLVDIAGYVGWTDARLEPRMTRQSELEEEWATLATKRLRKRVEEMDEHAEIGGVRFHVRAKLCGKDAQTKYRGKENWRSEGRVSQSDCVVEVELKAQADIEVSLWRDEIGEHGPWLVYQDGTRHGVDIVRYEGRGSDGARMGPEDFVLKKGEVGVAVVLVDSTLKELSELPPVDGMVMFELQGRFDEDVATVPVR